MSKHDLLIIGAGLAGLRAAVEGVRQGLNVAVITKVHPVRSHSNAAQGGINAALTDRGDDWRDHALATIKGSDYLADQDAVEVMCREAGDAIIELENMGVIFSRDDDGKLGTRAFGGQKRQELTLLEQLPEVLYFTFYMNSQLNIICTYTRNGL